MGMQNFILKAADDVLDASKSRIGNSPEEIKQIFKENRRLAKQETPASKEARELARRKRIDSVDTSMPHLEEYRGQFKEQELARNKMQGNRQSTFDNMFGMNSKNAQQDYESIRQNAYKQTLKEKYAPKTTSTVADSRGASKGDFGNSRDDFIRKRHGSSYDYDAILKKSGGDAAKADKQFQKMLGKDYAETYKGRDAIQGALTGKLNTRIGEKRVMDNMAYHKVPQAAAAIGTTAWLVSRMSDSKGQMSNSQLYGQAPQ